MIATLFLEIVACVCEGDRRMLDHLFGGDLYDTSTSIFLNWEGKLTIVHYYIRQVKITCTENDYLPTRELL